MTKDDLNELWLGLYKAISAVTPPPPFSISESETQFFFCSSLVSLNGKGEQKYLYRKLSMVIVYYADTVHI